MPLRILHFATSSKFDIPEENRKKLAFTLIPSVSDIHNEYASRMDLHEICLMMLHICCGHLIFGSIPSQRLFATIPSQRRRWMW
jgi:hypothetical protein